MNAAMLGQAILIQQQYKFDFWCKPPNFAYALINRGSKTLIIRILKKK
jgi:hypothetical protein